MTGTGSRRVPEAYRAGRGLSGDVLRVLQKRGNATIGTINLDGTVHMAPVWFLFDESGQVYFECNSATRKARNIEANRTGSVLVKGKAVDGSGMVVLGQGTARIIKGDMARVICTRIREKYLTVSGIEPVSAYLDSIDDAVAELSPASWVSWNSRIINDSLRALAQNVAHTLDEWLLPDCD